MAVYDIEGNVISGSSASANVFIPDESPSFYDKICKSINHRGWVNDGAEDNSIEAYKASKEQGFYYVETDVRYTSDNVAILYHDDTINGTSVKNMTYAEVLALVPTLAKFDDFIELCRDICLHPYIELKGTPTQAQINALVDIVYSYQMQKKSTWFGNNTNVSMVKGYDPNLRLALLAHTLTSTVINQAKALKLSTNEVFVDTEYSNLTSEILSMVKLAGLPLEVYTFSTGSTEANEILSIDPYITGFTTNSNIAGKVIYDANVEQVT